MEKIRLLTGFCAALLLTGCAHTPATDPVASQPIFEEILARSVELREAGGLVATGSATSANRNLALNRALADGRIRLARELEQKIEALAARLAEETGQPLAADILARFDTAARTLIGQTISALPALRLDQETSEEAFTACALLVLSPSALTRQFAEDRELFALLRPSKVFEDLEAEAALFDSRFADPSAASSQQQQSLIDESTRGLK
jgi:hypothetical protein